MSRSHLLRSILFLLSLLLLPAVTAFSQESNWGTREVQRYTEEQQLLRQREAQAQQAINKAEAAQRYARELNDLQALPIAEKAVATAERALERIRRALQRNESRVASVERLRAAGVGGIRAALSTLRGTVEVKTAAGWRRLTPDSLLGPGEEIRTGVDGYAEVMFSDGSRVNLDAGSAFKLAGESKDTSNYELSLGRIKAQIERLDQRRYAVRTPTAIVGVRGTEFLLETSPDGGSSLTVLHGEVAFGAVGGDGGIAVRQGERATLAPDGTLRGPEAVELKKIAAWWE